MPRRSLLLLAAGALLAPLLLARDARAEEVVMATGHRYDATEVSLVGDKVRFTYLVGSGSATVTVPAKSLEPRSLFLLVLARTPRDAGSQLALGWFALEHGLLPEAKHRFQKAAQADASLASERDRGLAAVRHEELERVLESAETDLRRGRFEAGIAKASDVAARAEPGSDLATKAAGLVEMARRREEQEGKRLAAEAQARADAVAAAEAGALDAALARADKAVFEAIDRRKRIAQPGIPASRVRSELEAAEALLREARRLLAGAVDLVAARREEVLVRDDEALGLLVATLLDLADSHRQGGRLTKALDHVRAALLLDPDNARALEVQRQIEDALRAPYVDPYSPYLWPSTGYGVIQSYPYLYRRTPIVRRSWIRSGGGHIHAGGSHWHLRGGW